MDAPQPAVTAEGIRIYKPEDFAGMRAAGQVAAGILDRIADHLVAHHQWVADRDGAVEDLEIGAADAGATHLDEDVIGRHPGLRNVLEPKSFSRLFFNECLHLSCKKDFHVMGAEAPG